MDKVGKFVTYHVFNARERRVNKVIVKGKYIVFVVAATPATLHSSEFYFGEG